mgnify:FL=1
MTESNLEPQTPPQGTPAGEQTPPQTTTPQSPDELEELRKKNTELEAQKEHWRTKYERDITNVPNPEPVPSSEEVFSDEGKLLEKKISSLESELTSLKTDSAKKDLQNTHPILKEKWSDFEEFRQLPENKGMNLRTAAKSFLVENGLIDVPRKGLEKPTGGSRVPLTSGMTADDVKHLRETDFKKYQQFLMEGKIKIES